jgi:UDP-N-acetylglucosamine--N-acetylmuramyl-(pentapeptide) pyrophosphoryl-undecaprenol N-acetylglucosamine transferase
VIVAGTKETPDAVVRVVIAGGGTGGHLYPGIAVARELLKRRPDIRISFAGTARGIEARVVPREGFPLDFLRSGGLKGKSMVDRARAVALLPLGLVDAWRIVAARRPHLVIGVGGYSSGPVVLAAAARGVATMVLEQNAVPGLTNRMLAPFVRAAAVTFESTCALFGSKGFVSGNPVRPEFLEMVRDGRDSGVTGNAPGAAADAPGASGAASEARVLVFGGSQGAHAINVAMADAAAALAAASPSLGLTHQTGERDLEMVRDAYRRAGLGADVQPFLYDMARRIANADLIVCRAGATTLAEITAAGKAAILIPLPAATDDHQRKNAEVLASVGAARLLPQAEMTGPELARRILELAADAGARARIAAAARAMAKPDAARVIVDRALKLIGRSA